MDLHMHYVSLIETGAADVYDGPRVAVSHTKLEADADVVDWINDELDEEFSDAELAMMAYTARTGRHCKVEECQA